MKNVQSQNDAGIHEIWLSIEKCPAGLLVEQ